MSLSRRFLYVVDKYTRRRFLHRIDTYPLFYPHGSADHAANTVVDAPLPERSMSFDLPGSMQFALLGRDKDKIFGVDDKGRAVLFDDALHSVCPLPTMAPPKSWRILSVAVDGAKDDGSVYFIDADPMQGLRGPILQPVQALLYEHNEDDWVWRSLPPPPYTHEPAGYVKGGCAARATHEITCHAVDGDGEGSGSLVWVSTAGRGTYCLDTATHVWTKAGDWALPFRGEAVPAPGLVFWLGFSAVDSGHICVSDLAAAMDEERPPAPDQVWEGFAVPEGFHELHSHLVYLGGLKFCVAKVFERTPQSRPHCCCCSGPPDKDEGKYFAMFTGVEVVHGSAGRYCMTKHRSLRYCLGYSFDGYVL